MTEETKAAEEQATAPAVETENQENQTEKKKSQASLPLSAFYGIKAGMTRIFDNEGRNIPVTVVKLIPNYVTQVKSSSKEGYDAYQIGYGEKREKLVKSPVKGHLKKAKVPANVTRFFELKTDSADSALVGKAGDYTGFDNGTYVDVTGTSKGKGFQGVIKRFSFSGGPASHGSHFHRSGGSIGNRATPGRVFKQKKMPGHMGSKKITTQNLKVVEVNTDQGYMLIKGSIPGHKNDFVKVSKAIKK